MERRRTIVSSLPTTEERFWGRYRSIHGESYPDLVDDEEGVFRLFLLIVAAEVAESLMVETDRGGIVEILR